jgi:hypothetical protein
LCNLYISFRWCSTTTITRIFCRCTLEDGGWWYMNKYRTVTAK